MGFLNAMKSTADAAGTEGACCAVCKKPLDAHTPHVQVSNGTVCCGCLDESGLMGLKPSKKLTVAEIRKSRERTRTKTLALAEQERLTGMLTPNIALADDAFLVDTNHQLFSICGTVFRFGSLRGYDLVENKQTTGRASSVGGEGFFGGFWSESESEQIEMCYSICVRVRLRDAYVDYADIPIFSGRLDTRREEYANLLTAARECMDALRDIAKAISPAPKEDGNTVVSAADEIMKFKQLADMGVITAEEFEAKKCQLLGL